VAIFANVARRSRMNSLRMARPSRHDNPPIRKLKSKIKKIVQTNRERSISARNLGGIPGSVTISRGGDSQRDWMRWRQPENAILELLNPEVRQQLIDKGLGVKIVGPTEQAQYNPFTKEMSIRSGMQADAIRHEQLHAGLALAPELFPNVGAKAKFASSPLGTALGAMNTRLFPKAGQQFWAETAAISMGGAEAYPGYTPAYDPNQFSNIFNTEQASWQYPTQSGWKIGK